MVDEEDARPRQTGARRVSVNTIWVPKGWSVEQVLETIRRGGKVPTTLPPVGSWVNVDENGKVIVPDA